MLGPHLSALHLSVIQIDDNRKQRYKVVFANLYAIAKQHWEINTNRSLGNTTLRYETQDDVLDDCLFEGLIKELRQV